MLQTVDIGSRSLDSYRSFVPPPIFDELASAAQSLAGARVLHLSATPYGGGVSELLRSAVPLLENLGIHAVWQVISGEESFFRVTKAIHNGLQGAAGSITEVDRAIYKRNSTRNAALLDGEYDFVFVHDPQPAAVLSFAGRRRGFWIWRCHIDTSAPNPEVWEFVRRYLVDYEAAVFTAADFVPPDLPVERVEVIPPAIDPLSPKNLALSGSTGREVLDWIGVDADAPLVTQVSRFDPWKDPLGVIAAYRLVRERVPGLQLALVGSMALDDPEAWDVYREIREASATDALIHVFTNLTGVGNVEVNAFQRLSDVVIQKSIREGFGLAVSEAMWKATPVVAGRAGGIPLQMADGAGGLLVGSVEELADAVVWLLEDPAAARELGRLGRDRVRDFFLLPRLLLSEIDLMRSLVEGPDAERTSIARDPVCGLLIAGQPVASVVREGRRHDFCSHDCRERFLRAGAAAGGAQPHREE